MPISLKNFGSLSSVIITSDSPDSSFLQENKNGLFLNLQNCQQFPR